MPIQITNQMIKDLGKCRFDPVANRKVYYLFGHVLFESMDKHNPYTKRINKSKVLIHDNPVSGWIMRKNKPMCAR